MFKGGTVLKKIYFADYRFSEDPDFTLLTNEITNEQIFAWFKEAFEFIREEANIPLEIIDNNEHEAGGINFYISFIGPLVGQGNNKREQHSMEADFYLDEFSKKCASKGLNPADFPKKLAERLPQYKGRWKSAMSEQIQDLPSFDKVEREL